MDNNGVIVIYEISREKSKQDGFKFVEFDGSHFRTFRFKASTIEHVNSIWAVGFDKQDRIFLATFANLYIMDRDGKVTEQRDIELDVVPLPDQKIIINSYDKNQHLCFESTVCFHSQFGRTIAVDL